MTIPPEIGVQLETEDLKDSRRKQRELTYRGARVISPYDALLKQEPRPPDIGLDTIRSMENDPVIVYGLSLLYAPILASVRDARIECEDLNIKAFLEATFLPLLYPLVRDCLLALPDGSSIFEKVWESRYIEVERDDVDGDGGTKTAYKGNALVYKQFRHISMETLDEIFVTYPGQDFDGFSQQLFPVPARVWAWKSLVYANQFNRGGYYGRSALNCVYAPWYIRQKWQALETLWYSKRAAPPRIGYAPPGLSQDEDGNDVDNLQFLAQQLYRLEEFITIALPSEIDENSGKPLWTVEELGPSAPTGSSPYREGIAALNTEILQGLFVVEDAPPASRSTQQTYYQGKSRYVSFVDALEMRREDIYQTISRYCLPQLIEDNFGVGEGGILPVAHIQGKKISAELERMLLFLLGLLSNAGHPDLQLLDLRNIAEMVGIQVKPESERIEPEAEPATPQELGLLVHEFAVALEREAERGR